MDAAVLALVVAVSSVLVFVIQLGELGVGIFNVRGIRSTRAEVRQGVQRADEGREKILEVLAELKAKKIDAPKLEVPADPRIDALIVNQREIGAALNQVVELLNAQVAAAQQQPAKEFNGVDPREARAARSEKEDERALAAADLKGQLGPVVVEIWKRWFPDEWADAIKRPHLAMEIFRRLRPQLDARAKLVETNGTHSAAVSPLDPYMVR